MMNSFPYEGGDPRDPPQNFYSDDHSLDLSSHPELVMYSQDEPREQEQMQMQPMASREEGFDPQPAELFGSPMHIQPLQQHKLLSIEDEHTQRLDVSTRPDNNSIVCS